MLGDLRNHIEEELPRGELAGGNDCRWEDPCWLETP